MNVHGASRCCPMLNDTCGKRLAEREEFKKQRRTWSCESCFQSGERFGDFGGVAKTESRVRGAPVAYENGHALASGDEGGLVGIVVAKINGQGVAELPGPQASADRGALVGHAPGRDFQVADILENAKMLAKWAQKSRNAAARVRRYARPCGGNVDGEAAALVFDPHTWKRGQILAEDGACPAQRDSRGGRDRRAAASFPAIQAQVTDLTDGNVAQKFGAAPATDHRHQDARMARQAAEQAARGGSQTNLVGAQNDGREGAVEIEKQGDPGAVAKARGHQIPVRKQIWKGAGGPGHGAGGASIRSGVSMRISVRSERRLAAQR